MRRKNAIELVVDSPSKGLITRVPSNQPRVSGPDKRAIVVATNVRADDGVLRNAPGYERIVPGPTNLDSPANMIFQADIRSAHPEIRTTPIIGTGGKLFTVTRRARPLVCDLDECRHTAAFIGDSGKLGDPLEDVVALVDSWGVGTLIHLGDMTYAGEGESTPIYDLEELVGQFFYNYIGGYSGFYGIGPEQTKFFPVLGNHDWDDSLITEYYDFFNLPGNERYYTVKRGPVQFFIFSGYTAEEPDGVTEASTQGQWLVNALDDSDCPHRVVCVHFPSRSSEVAKYPGQVNLQWIEENSNVSAIVTGHAHCMEVIECPSGVPILTCGNGGHSLRGFHDPPVDGSVFRYSDDYGALKLFATTTELTFDFYARTGGSSLFTYVVDTAKESSGVCYISDAASAAVALEVRPDTATVEVGYSYPYRAFVTRADGNVDDVTTESIWSSSDDGIASVGTNSGIATGKSPGTTQLTAAYGGQTDSAEIVVLANCLDCPMDVVLCLDRSESMATAAGGTSNRMQALREACEQFLDSLDSDTDAAALVSFAGDFATQEPDARLDQALTTDLSRVKDHLTTLVPFGGSGVADGLAEALAEVTSVRHRSNATQVVVLFVDGPADIKDGGTASPESTAITDAMSAATTQAALVRAEAVLIVIGYDVPAAYQATVTSWASAGYAFQVNSPEELKTTMVSLANQFCVLDDGYFCYYGYPQP